MQQKTAIIIGASSGIGRALAKELVKNQYKVAILSRRVELLNELKAGNPSNYVAKYFDITDIANIDILLDNITKELGSIDLLVISAGVGHSITDKIVNFELEKKVIDTNVMGFTKVVIWAYNYFIKQGKGHLVIISSVAGHRGSKNSPTYSASKAYQMNFIEGLWHRSYKLKLPIIITDVRPGFVKTAMAKGDYIFWATSAENAASQIYKAIRKKRKVIYVTKRWFIIALLLKILPNRLYKLG